MNDRAKENSEEPLQPEECCDTPKSAAACNCGSDSTPGCCSSSSSSTDKGKSLFGKSWGKITLFFIIMAAAAAVGGYSIAKRSSGSSDESALSGGSVCCPRGAAMCAPKLSATAQKLVKNHDAVFIMLPHQYLEPEMPIEPIMQATVSSLNSKGKNTDGVTLEALTEDYTALAREFSVLSFPTMLVLSQSGNVQFVTGEITEDRLTRAFVVATASASGCCPPSGKNRG